MYVRAIMAALLSILVLTPSKGLMADTKRAGVTTEWLRDMMAQIERQEYHASVNEHGLQAPNRGQDFRTYFEDDGIKVVPRTGWAGDAWSFSWHTVGWGREGHVLEVGEVPCEMRVNRSRVSYVRDGLEEWYENNEKGLEQGFVVSEKPEGDGLFCIEGRIGCGLRAEFYPGEGAID
ncbi:MAG: hypothetical protein JSW50_13180, partial [Candidatus Latescibacterota bacterium]